MLDEKVSGTKIRTKCKVIDNNERPSKFFTQKEKHNASLKYIEKLESANGTLDKMDEIKKEVYDFYKNLFQFEEIDQQVADHFLEDLPKLSTEQKDLCEGVLLKEECLLAIKNMENDKSPGCDGLPAEFYKKFFYLFGDAFVDFVNNCFQKGELSPSQRPGTISLLCKNLTNWCPTSLLNFN